jgi:hypothetical protein
MTIQCRLFGHKPKQLSKISANLGDTFMTLLSGADNEGRQTPVGHVNICDRCGLLYWAVIKKGDKKD